VIRRALLGLLVLLPVVLAAPEHAQAQDRPSAVLGLASQTPWVRDDASFILRLDVDRVRNPQQLDLRVTVHRAVRSRSQFRRTIDGELLGSGVHTEVVPFVDLPFDAGGAVPLSISLPSLRVGVYPVSVAVVDHRTGATITSFVTHLLRVPSDPVEVPLSVAWLQPYGVDPALQPDGTTAVGEDALDQLRAMASTMDDGVPLTVLPTPETIAALATVDDGVTVRALADLLAPHQVVSTPFADIDVGALVAAGRTDDLLRQRTEGDRVLRETLDVTGDNRTWSVDGPLSPDALNALAALGVTQVVVDEDALVPLDSAATGGLTLTRPYALAGRGDTEVEAASADRELAEHFEEDDDVLAAHHLLADLAVLQLDSPGVARGIVVRPPSGAHPTDAFLSTALSGIESSPLLDGVTLDDLFDTVEPLASDDEPVVREVDAGKRSDERVPGLAIDRARERMSGFASLAGASNPALRLFERMLLLAESSDVGIARRQAYVDAVGARIGDTGSKVHVLGERTYRLTAREGKIPLTLVNDNPFDVRVDVELTSDKLTFTNSAVQGRLDLSGVVVRANGTATQAIPVKARTSGAFPMRVTVRSPDRRLEIGRATYTITSTVASGVGIFLSVGAVVFLLLWWGSHWRTVRRARRLVTADE
jgi:hypothetical protein